MNQNILIVFLFSLSISVTLADSEVIKDSSEAKQRMYR